MNVGHADGRQHGQVDDANAAAEIAAIHRNDQFEDRGAHDGGVVVASCGTLGERRRASLLPKIKSRVAPSISQGSTRMKVCAGVRSRQKRAADSAAEPAARSGSQHSSGHIKPVAIGASAGGRACPERERIGGVGWNGRHADEKKCGKGQETASASHRVQGPADDAGDKKKDGVSERQG